MQTLSNRPEVRSASGWGAQRPGAHVGISRLLSGLQAEPEPAQLWQALQTQPRQRPSRGSSVCLDCSRRGQQGTDASGPTQPSSPPQAPRVSRPRLPSSRGPGDVTAALTRAHGGTGGGGAARASSGEVPVLAARGRVLGPPPGEPRFSKLGKAGCPSATNKDTSAW